MPSKTVTQFRSDHPAFFNRSNRKFFRDISVHTWRGFLIVETPHGHAVYQEMDGTLHHVHGAKSLADARAFIDTAYATPTDTRDATFTTDSRKFKSDKTKCWHHVDIPFGQTNAPLV